MHFKPPLKVLKQNLRNHFKWPTCIQVIGAIAKLISDLVKGVLLDLVESPHPLPESPSINTLRDSLINVRQHERFLKILMVSE